jgi:diguanylate cyclase (GGDEF)-like protein
MTPQEKIEALREKYKKELPSKFFEISNLFEKYETKGFDHEGFEKFYRLVHNLVGSGATFGLMNVSEKARALDDILKPYIVEQKLPSIKNNLKIKITLNMLARVCTAKHLETSSTHIQTTSSQKTESLITNGETYLLLNADDNYTELDEHLKNFGLKVTVFYKHTELLNAVDKQLPELLILDYNFLAIEELSTKLFLLHEDETNNFIIFTLSNIDNFRARVKSVQSGSDWFFTKPVDSDMIIEKFDTLSSQEIDDPVKVVILDDEIDVANYYASLLEDAGIDTKCIDQPEKIIDTMAEYKPDLLITDLYMHECNGGDIAKVLRQFDEYVTMPIIFLSIENNETIQNRAISSGAEDFMLKSIEPSTLVAKVRSKVKRSRSMRDKIQKDSLTNLYNHITVLNFLEKEVEAAKRYNHDVSFVMLDIDYFKKVNDTYGHQTGDAILKSLSYLLKHRVRESDIVGRYGGEEFAVILPYTTLDDAVKIIEEIRKKFANLVHSDGQQEFHTTFSAGVCQYLEGMSVTELIENADEALYKAKENGRNQTMRCSELS